MAPSLPPAILSALHEPGIPVGPDDPVVQPSPVDEPDGRLGVVPVVILDEAEATRSPLKLVQPHDDPFDLAALPEEFIDLLLGGVEAHVPRVQGGALVQQPLL